MRDYREWIGEGAKGERSGVHQNFATLARWILATTREEAVARGESVLMPRGRKTDDVRDTSSSMTWVGMAVRVTAGTRSYVISGGLS